MDYKTYLDFVLALENRQEPQSLQYLFRILDFDHQGYLTSFTLNYFFKVRFDQENQFNREIFTRFFFRRVFKSKLRRIVLNQSTLMMWKTKFSTWSNQGIQPKLHWKTLLKVDKAKQWSPYSSNSINSGPMKIERQWSSTRILKNISPFYKIIFLVYWPHFFCKLLPHRNRRFLSLNCQKLISCFIWILNFYIKQFQS